MTFVIEALARRHDRSRFSCGSEALDHYIRRQASQDVRRKMSRVFVALPGEMEEVAGFYTLSAGSIERTQPGRRPACSLSPFPAGPSKPNVVPSDPSTATSVGFRYPQMFDPDAAPVCVQVLGDQPAVAVVRLVLAAQQAAFVQHFP